MQCCAEMIKYVVIFLLLWGAITLGLSTWRYWTKSGAISAAKSMGLSLLGAAASTAILAAIVILF